MRNMNRILIVMFTLLVGNWSAFSQGFDWELSPRLPQSYSNLFFGIGVGYNLGTETGNFNFYEDDCNCGKFTDGKSSMLNLSLQNEYWLGDGTTSIISSLSLINFSPEFSAMQSLPVLIEGNEEYFKYKNTYSSEIAYFNLSIGAKRRLFESFFYVSGDLNFSFLISDSQQHTEEIVSPDWAPPFNTNPPSRRRIVSEGKVEDLHGIMIYPTIALGYDIDLGIGYYASAIINYKVPMMNVISEGQWRSHSFGAKLSIYRWF